VLEIGCRSGVVQCLKVTDSCRRHQPRCPQEGALPRCRWPDHFRL